MKKRITYSLLTMLAGIIILTGCGQEKQQEEASTTPVSLEKTAIDETVVSVHETTISVYDKNGITYVNDFVLEDNPEQIALVVGYDTSCEFIVYTKSTDNNWELTMSTVGFVGSDGIGTASEDSCHTPEGIYHITDLFGILPNPGTALNYLQADESLYWVDDVNSIYYNKLVSTNYVDCDWNSAENILASGDAYNYVVAFDYNKECTPGKGSAFFIHCSEGIPTEGCISLYTDAIKEFIIGLKENCDILIYNCEDY